MCSWYHLREILLLIEVVVAEVVILRGVVAAEPIEPHGGEVAAAEERVCRLAGLDLLAQLRIFDVPVEDALRHVEPQRVILIIDAVAAPVVHHVVHEQLHHVDARRAAEVTAAPEPRVDLKEDVAPRAAVVLHVDVGETDVAECLEECLHFIVQHLIAAREDGGVVADGLGIVVFQHRLSETHRAHLAVKIGVAVEHAHRVVAAGDEFLNDELAAIPRRVHRFDHLEVFFACVEEKHLFLPLEVAAEVIKRVAVFGLDDDWEVERQIVDRSGAFIFAAHDGLGIVETVLLAQGIEAVFGVKGFQQAFGDETVGDQPRKAVVMAAEQSRVVVRAGDDEQLAILLGALLEYGAKRVGKHVLALKVLDDAAEEQMRVPRGDKLLRAQQQRRDVRVRLAEQPRSTVGVFVAA